MDWGNLIVGSCALHNITKAYVKFENAIVTFVDTTSPINIITNETILTYYNIK